MGLGLSASTIKSWFQYRCERKTRYELMDQSDRAAIPLIQDDREQPWRDLGIAYERRVLDRLTREKAVLRPTASQDSIPERLAVAFFRGENQAEYAAQLNLKPREKPQQLAGIPNLRLRKTYADLVRCDRLSSVPVFQVIDIKATRSATAFHKTQVAFYTRMLESVLTELSIPHRIDALGSIWRIPDSGTAESDTWFQEEFALAPYLRIVDDFCNRTLATIASKEVTSRKDETFFHLYFKCEQCAYLPHCIKAVDPALPPSRRDVSATAGLTHEAKRFLQSNGVRNTEQLARAAGLHRIDEAGWSLTRRAETLIVRADALNRDAVIRASEPHTFLMPPRSDVALYLLADHDPVDDSLVTLGYLKVENGQTTETIVVLPSSHRGDEADALVRVFTQLITDLERIDSINSIAPKDHGLFSHIYMFEPSEAISLQTAVKRHLDDPRIRGGLLHLVRLFPPEEIVPEPEFRGVHHLPATAVRSVVEQLYALPVTVSYDLRQVSAALFKSKLIDTAYVPEEAFRREFSSLLSIDVSRRLRERRKGSVDPSKVENDVRARLRATRAIVEWLQRANKQAVESGDGPMLRLTKKPFRLQATFNPLQMDDLDVLRALELLENRSGLLDALVRLSQPVGVRREAGRCASNMLLRETRRLGAFSHLVFDVPPESQKSEFESSTFGLILTDDDPDLRLNPRVWPDLNCSILPSRPSDPPKRLRISMRTATYDSQVFQTVVRRAPPDGWCLDHCFVDFNLSKADAFLSFLANGENSAGAG